MVVCGEMRSEQADRCQVKRAVCDELDDDGQLARRTGRLDPQIRGVFGKVQDLGAIGEQG
jgi:hypothetical protein